MATILIIDNTADLSNLIAEILRLEGYDVLQAFDASSGLQLAKEHLPNLILSDLYCRAWGDLVFLRQLSETPSIAHIPVIVISAMGGHVYKAAACANGAALYFLKPFDVPELLGGIRGILD